MLATDKQTNKEMAIKMIDKGHIKKEKKEAYAVTERDILTKCDSPWVIKLYYTFQDSTYLCIRFFCCFVPLRPGCFRPCVVVFL